MHIKMIEDFISVTVAERRSPKHKKSKCSRIGSRWQILQNKYDSRTGLFIDVTEYSLNLIDDRVHSSIYENRLLLFLCLI